MATLFFRASASCSNILNDKKCIFNTVKNLRANSVFQGKRNFLKNPECKKYIQYSEIFQGNCFSGQAQSCSKILNGKKYIQCNEKFQGKLCFQGKRKLLKILNLKGILNTVKISGQLCFFRASATCSKIANGEKIFNTVYIFTWGDPCNLD